MEHGPPGPGPGAPEKSTTYLWDWERAAPAPAGLDLLHFLFQSVCRFAGWDSGRGRRDLFGADTVSAVRPRRSAGSEPALWLLYRLELLFRYDEARMTGVLARPSKIHEGILEMFARDMEDV